MKEKWNVSWIRFILIFTTFALGGSLCARLGSWLLQLIFTEKNVGYWILYIPLMTLLWPLCVLIVSIPLGQFIFFKNYLKKMGSRIRGKRPQNGESRLQPIDDDSEAKSQTTIKLAIFASGAGSNARKIIEHFNESAIVKVSLVVCNNPKAGVLAIADEYGIPVLMVSKKCLYQDDVCVRELQLHQVNWVILAGFLWMIPQNLIDAFRNRIINIHPALLPKFGGKGMYGNNVHKAVIEAGEKESGITIHYVDEHYDNGDVIFQAKCAVKTDDTPASLAERIHRLEHEHYPTVIERLVGK